MAEKNRDEALEGGGEGATIDTTCRHNSVAGKSSLKLKILVK